MGLTEDRRKQLDDIVMRMTQNKENDGDIQTVVEDFKGKYGGDNPQVKQVGTSTNVPPWWKTNLIDPAIDTTALMAGGLGGAALRT